MNKKSVNLFAVIVLLVVSLIINIVTINENKYLKVNISRTDLIGKDTISLTEWSNMLSNKNYKVIRINGETHYSLDGVNWFKLIE